MTDLQPFARGLAFAPTIRVPLIAPVAPVAPRLHRLRWTALRYRLPRTTSGIRSSVWRELTDVGALNLQYGVWALPHGRDQDRLESLFARIRAAGGEVSAAIVGRETLDDIELQSRLTRACDRLWDAFFNDADLLASKLAQGEIGDSERHAALDDLRSSFATVMVRDVIGSEAAGRASVRLDTFLAEILDAPDPTDHRTDGAHLADPVDGSCAARHGIEVVATWMLENGDLRGAARVAPYPTARWERAFEDFEARLYKPSARRVPVRHGTLTWTCAPDALESALASLDARLAHFRRSLG